MHIVMETDAGVFPTNIYGYEANQILIWKENTFVFEEFPSKYYVFEEFVDNPRKEHICDESTQFSTRNVYSYNFCFVILEFNARLITLHVIKEGEKRSDKYLWVTKDNLMHICKVLGYNANPLEFGEIHTIGFCGSCSTQCLMLQRN